MKTILVLLSLIASVAIIDRTRDPMPVYKCTLTFETLNAGFVTTGTIDGKILEETFDPTLLDKSTVIVVAVPSTIKTGIAIRDKHLQRDDYFDTERYPEIRLTSRSFKKVGSNKFQGKFTLCIKDISKEVEVTFAVRHEKGKIRYEGTFEINRRDFNVGEASITLADEVAVSFKVEKHLFETVKHN